MKIIITTISVVMLLVATAGCSGDTSLKGAFEKQMRDDLMDEFNQVKII